LNKTVYNSLLPLLIGIVLGIFLLHNSSLVVNSDVNFDELAFAGGTTSYFAKVNQLQIHCSSFPTIYQCINDYKNFGGNEEVVLWLGNSQLHAINQMRTGDETASAILYRGLKTEYKHLLTFSQPNASLQEHYVLYEYLSQKLPISYLLLPVVFDDLRETGIRFGLIDAFKISEVSTSLSRTEIGRNLIAIQGDKDVVGSDMDALDTTVQEKVENFLNSQLESIWGIWAERSSFRGNVMNNLYLLRNWIFGITPSSARKMIPGRYSLNMQSLQAIMHSANQKGIKVLIYIVPIRDDVTIPYDLHQYNKFKSEVELAAKNESARFINIEGLVPVKLWGSKDSTTIGVVKELDFMHFKEKGHELLAERLLSELELLWSEGK